MCRLYETTEFHHIDKGLYVYRVHGNNTWLQFNEEIQNNVYRIYDQYIETGDKAAAAKVFAATQATIDKIADKKIAHKNTAARQKSRLSAAIKAMAA